MIICLGLNFNQIIILHKGVSRYCLNRDHLQTNVAFRCTENIAIHHWYSFPMRSFCPGTDKKLAYKKASEIQAVEACLFYYDT